MYVYFDKNGTLKEIINDIPERQGSADWNSIYVFWEDEENKLVSEGTLTAYIRYTRADGELLNVEIAQTSISVPSQSELDPNEECIIPYNENQDLKFFKYHKQYKFYKFTIPQGVLTQGGNVVSRIRYVDSQSTLICAMGLFTFDIESTNQVAPEVVMSVAQYNQIISMLTKGSQIFPVASVEDVNDYEIGTILLNTTNGYFYKVVAGTTEGTKTAQKWATFNYVDKAGDTITGNLNIEDYLKLKDTKAKIRATTSRRADRVEIEITGLKNETYTNDPVITLNNKQVALVEDIPNISFVDTSEDPQSKKYIRVNSVDYSLGVWGAIGGTLSDQTDLATALAGKENADETILKKANVIDNYNSTATNLPLSANKGKDLNDRINNLESRARFLSLWNATTGVAVSNPPTSPYIYKTGDYFRVSVEGYRVPNGSTYVIGGTNYITSEIEAKVGDVFYYDGTQWVKQEGTGESPVLDVQTKTNTTYESVLDGSVAKIDLTPYLQKSGGTMTGTLSMNGNNIGLATNVNLNCSSGNVLISGTPANVCFETKGNNTTIFKVDNNGCQYKGEDLTSVEIVDWEE